MAAASATGNLVGKRYQLVTLIGTGGMGSVYRARDHLTGQEIALKRVTHSTDNVTFSTSYDMGDFRLALAREFKFLASLRHPNIIEVLDYGFDANQQPYYTMELLEDARTILDAGKGQPLDTQLSLLVQMLYALAYLHRRDILHRDLKPGNVMVTAGGQVKLLDFGLSIMRDRVEVDEPDNTTAGTLAYMAPEILVGGPASIMSDLYAFGMMAFELIAGKHPFASEDAGTLINHILYTIPEPDAAAIAADTGLILSRLLQKDPNDRYQSAVDVIDALAQVTTQPIQRETLATRESFLQAARLVGRDAEIHQLTRALHQAAHGQGSAWLVTGESGVGKSRLLDELRTLALVEGVLVVRGQAAREGQAPFFIWRRLLRWVALLLDLNDAEQAVLMRLVPDIAGSEVETTDEPTTIDPHQTLQQLVQVIRRLFGTLTQPVLLLFEDLQWVGRESLTLLAEVCSQVAELPLLVVGTYREDIRPDLSHLLPPASILRLPRLSQDHIGELSAAMLGESGRQQQVVNLLQRETEGNVFFVIEVVRALAEEAGSLEEIGKMTLPEHVFAGGIQQIVQRRLDHVPDWARPALETAAVAGRKIAIDLMKDLFPDLDINQWLLTCSESGVLDVLDGDWQFAHDRLRDTLRDNLPVAVRVQQHERLARAIEERCPIEEWASALAYHWHQAGNTGQARRYFSLAGEQASRSGAYREAIALFTEGLALLADATGGKPLEQRLATQQQLAEAHLGLGEYAEAETIYRQTVDRARAAGLTTALGAALNALGDIAQARGEPTQAREHYQDALASYRLLDDKIGMGRVLHNLGNIAYDMGDDIAARQLYQQSMDYAREGGEQWGMAGSIARQTAQQDSDSTQHTRSTMLREILQQQIDAGSYAEASATLVKLGDIARELGDYQTAASDYERSLSMRHELADIHGVVEVYNHLGMLAIDQGEYRTAGHHLRRALKTANDNEETLLSLQALFQIASLNAQQGKSSGALEMLAALLNQPEIEAAGIEDEAERLAFSLQDSMEPSRVQEVWDRGKHTPIVEVIKRVLSLP